MGEDFKEIIFQIRERLLPEAENIKKMVKHPACQDEQEAWNQHSEIRANIMLAYRHMEDCRMRLGKAIQAYDGGKSVYPR